MGRPTRDAVNGRATGSLFFIGFGGLWILTGLSSMHRLTPLRLIAVCAVCAALVAFAFLLFGRAKSIPEDGVSPAERARMSRIFTAVNIIQWVAVATAVAILTLLGKPQYVVPAIAIIVGLHLFPLADAFHYPPHYVTGAVLVLWSAGCIALLQASRIPGVGAFGTGCILLLSAAATLAFTLRASRG